MRIFIILICLMTITLSGCAVPLIIGGAAAGAGTVIYIKGWLYETFPHPVRVVYNAADHALRHMGLIIYEKSGDSATAYIKARFSDNTHVWIEIETKGSATCELKIRVGTFGDEKRSRLILEEIHKALNRRS